MSVVRNAMSNAATKVLFVCIGFCLAGLVLVSPMAFAEGSSALGGAGGSPLESPLVVPEAVPLLGGQSVRVAEEARRDSPEAVIAREESREKFEGLDPGQAATVDGEAFPAAIDDPLGGPPQLPEGQQIAGFADATGARVDLGDHESVVVESSVPMATEASPGHWVAIDLGLSEAGGAFEPGNPLVGVRIPKQLAAGVQLPETGLSLTPVEGSGVPLGGSEGVVDGAGVLYANTQTDSDTLVKPSTFGVAVDTLLRSVDSPQELSFRVGLPEGASLVQAKDGSVSVVREGATVATIPPAAAWDAAGALVPVSMVASGDTLTLSVDHRAGEFQYPIDVDPEFNVGTDSTLSEQTWRFGESGGGFGVAKEGSALVIGHGVVGSAGNWGELYYKTNGDSRIYKVNTAATVSPTYFSTELFWNADARAYLEFEGSGGYENSSVVAQSGTGIKEEGGAIHSQLCVAAECSSANGSEHNLVRIVEEETGSLNAELLQLRLESATVSLSQPKETHSTVSYNTSAPEIEYTSGGKKIKTSNALYSGGWLGPNTGAIEFKAEDLGLGVGESKGLYINNVSLLLTGRYRFFTVGARSCSSTRDGSRRREC
jgi:hypothetical protein